MNMKKFARVLAVVMAVLMVTLCLASCGNKLSGTYSIEEEDVKLSYTFKGDKLTATINGETLYEGTSEIKDDKITVTYEVEGEEVSDTADFEKGSGYIKIDGVELKKD